MKPFTSVDLLRRNTCNTTFRKSLYEIKVYVSYLNRCYNRYTVTTQYQWAVPCNGCYGSSITDTLDPPVLTGSRSRNLYSFFLIIRRNVFFSGKTLKKSHPVVEIPGCLGIKPLCFGQGDPRSGFYYRLFFQAKTCLAFLL